MTSKIAIAYQSPSLAKYECRKSITSQLKKERNISLSPEELIASAKRKWNLMNLSCFSIMKRKVHEEKTSIMYEG